jgi:YegS C-terminal NAD kinase beta sandwich-like domain
VCVFVFVFVCCVLCLDDTVRAPAPGGPLSRTQTQHFGKGLRAAPRARWNDGLLDFGYLQRASRAEMMRYGSVGVLARACPSRACTCSRVCSIFLQLPVGSHETNPVLPYMQVCRCNYSPKHNCHIYKFCGGYCRFRTSSWNHQHRVRGRHVCSVVFAMTGQLIFCRVACVCVHAGIVNVDGEIYSYERRVEIACMHQAVRFFVPADCSGLRERRAAQPPVGQSGSAQ